VGKKKKDSSAAMAVDNGAHLDPKNIIDMTDGDIPSVKHQAFAELQKAQIEAKWKNFLSCFRKIRIGKVMEVQEFQFPLLHQPKVTPVVSKLLEANSAIANLIDGDVSATFNSKFAATSDNFESKINSHLDHIEAKFDKQFSDSDANASTSNIEKAKSSTLDDLSNLHIPKISIGASPANHVRSHAIIGTSADGGNTMAATNSMMLHTIVYSEPLACAYVPVDG
jgi:hypothetical protein